MRTWNLVLATLAFSASVYAQNMYVNPNATGTAAFPPVGSDRKGNGDKMELNIRPFCFGTNLRAYSADKQLKQDAPVDMYVKISGEANKVSEYKISFPAKATYAAQGITTACSVQHAGSNHTANCAHPSFGNAQYTLQDWKQKQNPACFAAGGYMGVEFCKYAGQPIAATKNNGSENLGDDVNCYYVFNDNHSLNEGQVRCYFKSVEDSFAAETKVYAVTNGAENEITGAEIEAYPNSISIKLPELPTAIPNSLAKKHGKPVPPAQSPQASVTSKQGGRVLYEHVEKKDIPITAQYRSLYLELKYAGDQGFCGGFYSPLMLFFDDARPDFKGLSSFPLYGVKEGSRVFWPEPNAAGHFLVHLPAGQKEVKGHAQLFGRTDKFANGFDALATHDSNGNKQIDKKDKIWQELFLWNDANGDGISQPNELLSLDSKKVSSINLKYSSRKASKWDKRAVAREKSTFSFHDGKSLKKAEVYDVWLAAFDE